MKCRLVICGLALFATASCASMYAEKTSVEVYRPDGSMLGKAVSNKGYTDFRCEVDIDGDKQHLLWTAKKINSDTVAAEAMEANKALSGALSGAVKTLSGLAGVPIR